ncbi:unnamed protein product [Phytomonas sp. EM1]|nr:unnamed protein product [Phytomonas sp. EM1]|eukprot:CCW61828.1 unnamed protein product [Phytomonas sp. isolate EM1]
MNEKSHASCLSFSSLSEAYVYFTCLMLGISILMPFNALISAPRYMTDYYKYVTGDEKAKPNNEFFWANIFVYYNIASTITQIIVGPTVLLPFARRFSLNLRFSLSITLMMSEVFVTLLLPAIKVSQEFAMVAFFIVTIAAGVGKSYLEATCYVLVGTMPSKFMSAVMFGCSFSGVTASILQCVIKASLPDTYESVRTQSYIYFSLTLACMAIGLVTSLTLRWNSFAQRFVGEYNMAKVRRGFENTDMDALGPVNPNAGSSKVAVSGQNDEGVSYARIVDTKSSVVESPTLNSNIKDLNEAGDEYGKSEAAGAQNYMTTSQQLRSTAVGPVFKLVYPSMIACFTTFLVTLIIFPSLVIPIDRKDNWFATIAVLLYNCGDATGRLSSSFRFLWVSRRVLLVTVCCRCLFFVPILLCIYKYIPGHIVPFLLIPVLGLTNGFFGSLAMVYGPITPGIRTDGQRAMAGQLMGISLLGGISTASLVAFGVVSVLGR